MYGESGAQPKKMFCGQCFMESKLKHIGDLMAKKEAELERRNYDKYRPVYDVAIQFFATRKVLLYGGTAINELLPEHLKIYSKTVLPDIDVFSVNAETTANALVRFYQRKGFKMASAQTALHEGTMKVYVDGLQVADITSVSKGAFDKLLLNAHTGPLGVLIVDPSFLLMTLHLMLSHSNDAHRWGKVYDRLGRFLTTRPLPNPSPTPVKDTSNPDAALVKLIYSHLKGKEYVVTGREQIAAMELASNTPAAQYPADIAPILLIVDKELQDVVAELIAIAPSLKASKIHAAVDFMEEHVILYSDTKRPLVAIFRADACSTYNVLQRLRVATIHTCIQLYMRIALSLHAHFKSSEGDIQSLVSQMHIIMKNSENSKKRILRHLTVDCYGTQPGLITMRRNRIQRLMKK